MLRALVVYESLFGNTEAVARAVAEGLGETFEVKVVEAREMPSAGDVDLLVAGAPTHAFGLSRPRTREDAARQGEVRPGSVGVGLREYLDVSPSLPGTAAATFDTRINKPLVPGSAAHRAHRRLRRLGCRMLLPAESFRVEGVDGPLVAGELGRARAWGARLAAAMPVAGRRA
ncbi:hypothetical protein Ade02nite_70480 [Paractinoplanes deccanensis]|uniref:Flavodoxin-like domain-containing protein n=1 Tax=Paractinoplanes deccanensis TaxID=113561 RepID=A0ABQ3YEI5_9ACTN|nr:flavodoxin domain-containing protein [Actinoplanes deccanensis]GID78407.1 hypothetical protein Ade02nite_70480 [Actinoplanes deccanensis]